MCKNLCQLFPSLTQEKKDLYLLVTAGTGIIIMFLGILHAIVLPAAGVEAVQKNGKMIGLFTGGIGWVLLTIGCCCAAGTRATSRTTPSLNEVVVPSTEKESDAPSLPSC